MKSLLANPVWLTAIAAVIAAIIPITSAINGHFRVRLERETHLDEMRLHYLDRAIRPGQSADERRSVLNFIIETEKDSFALDSWALGELAKIESASQLGKRTAELDARLESTRLATAASRVSGLETQVQELEVQAEQLRGERDDAERRANIALTSLSSKKTLLDETISSFRSTFRGNLDWIYDREGHRDSPYWAGGNSGITLAPGVDLGHVPAETIVLAYSDVLSEDELSSVLDVGGIRGEDARQALDTDSMLQSITISRREASLIFALVVDPYWRSLLRRFPKLGATSTPSAVQTAVLSLAFNRGPYNPAMESLGQPIASGNWAVVAQQIGSMQQDHRLIVISRRRQMEADLIRSQLDSITASTPP